MALRRPSLLRTRERALRSAAALVLGASVSASGFVALAEPAHADPPNAPVISDPAATVTSNDRTPTVTFDGTGLQYECSASLGAPSYSDCASPWAVPSLDTDGTWSLSVREKSVADDGVPATVAYTLDTKAQLTVTPPASPGKDPRPSWAISTEASGSVSCSLDSGPDVDCTSGFTPGADLADGTHTLAATATDTLGNTSPTSTTTYVLDTKPPTEPTVSGDSGIGNDPRPSWSWTNPEGATALCTLTTPSGAGSQSPCTTRTSYTAPTQSAQGDYSLSVVLVDDAGNPSTAGTSPTYTLDTVPSDPAVFGPGQKSPSTSPSVTWTFSEPGASSTCVLQGSHHADVSLGTCTSPVTVDPLAGDDAWTLAVTENDGHGNLVTTVGPTYVLDTTGPAAPTISAPSGLSNNATPHVTWTGELPSTAVCRWERTVGATVTDGPWTDCTARFFDPTLPGDGDYTFQAVLTDPLGNPGVVGTTTAPYVYDGTAPATPTLTVPATPGNDPAPKVTFAVETPGGTADCAFWSGTTTPAAPSWGDCTTGTFQPTLPADGTWTLAVRLADAAGNKAVPATFVYVLDRTSPPAVAITGYSAPSNDKTPTFGLVDNPALNITCQMWFGPNITGVKVGGKANCPNASGQYTSPSLNKGDGLYTLEVTAKSKAGNTTISTSPYTLDTTAPNAPVVTGPTGTHNYATLTWTFPVQTGTTAQCQLVQGVAQSAWSDCSSGSFSISNPADGTYTVNVQVTDLAQNAAPMVTTAAYTSDRTAPAAPVVTGPTGPGNNTAPTWTWTGEAGATATCRLDRAGVVGSAVACNSGSFKPALSGDTSYVVVVQLTDAAGNTSPATTTSAYLLDTVAPAAAVLTAGPSGAGSTATVTWSWTSEAGATSKCVLIRNGVAGAPATCASGTPVTLPSDATYVLQVTVVDPAGNAGPATLSASYALDRVAPLAPSVNTPVSPSSNALPAFTYTAEAGASVQCRLTRSGVLVKDWAACTSPLVDLSASPDGTYVLDVRATDAAGNVGAVGSSLGYVFDTTPPATAVVTGPASPSQSTTPTFTWTGEAGATSTCKLAFNGVVPATAVACSSPWTPTLSGDGTYVLRVRLTDAAGNLSTSAGLSSPYVLDTTPPATPVVTAPAALGRSTAPSWSATYEPGATPECRLTSGATVVADWSSCALPYVTDLSALPDATYTLGVRVTDAVGLVSPVGSASYQLDTTAPAAPVFVSSPPSPGRTRALSFAFTSDPGTTTYCKLTSGATVISPETTCTSPLPVSLSGLPDGPYTLSARSVDAATNNGPTQTATYVLDTAAPATPTLLSGPAATAPDTTPTWTFSAETGATLTCKVVGLTGFATSGTCTSPYKPTLPGDDTYTFTVTATDAAGNTSAPLTRTYVLDSTAPATADVVGPKSPGKTASPTWSVSSSEGQTQCQLVKGASTVVRDWANCGPTFSVLLPGDGTYTLSARVQDSAGNFSPVVTSVYVLDTVPPGVATIVTPGSPSTDRAPTFVISSTDANVTAQCQVTGPAGVISPFAGCPISAAGSNYNLDLSTAADGPYTLSVRLTDAAGNTGSATSATYVLDSSAPSAVLVTAPVTPSQDTTPTWALLGDTDAALECKLSGPGFAGPVFTACPTSALPGTGSFTADLTARADGTYTLTVRSRDAAGNLGPETSSGYELDRTPPATPAAPTTPADLTNNATVTWTFSVDKGATAHCTLSSASSVVTPDAACTSPLTTTLPGDGAYTLTLTAVDPAGNVSGAASTTVTYDSTPPAPPTVNDLPSPNPNASPAWTFVPSEPGTVMCELEGMPGAVFVPCTSGVSYDLPAEGPYTLHVYQTDLAGNPSTEVTTDYAYDKSAVLGALVFGPDPAVGHDTHPVFRIEVDPQQLDTIAKVECDVAVTVSVGTPATTAPVSPCTPNVPNTVDLSGLAPGTEASVVLGVRTYAKNGQTQGQSAKATYAFDNRPPPSPGIRKIVDFGRTNKVSWSWAGQDVDRETFVCTLTKAGAATLGKPLPCGGVNTGTMDVPLTSYGVWTLSVWAVDAAGNTSVLPATSAYDYLPPIPTLTVASLAAGTNPKPTWTFSVPRGYTADCIVSSTAGKQLFTGDCSSGRVTVDLTTEPASTYSLSVQLTDAHEEKGAFSKPATYRYTPRTSNDTHLGHDGPTTPTTGHHSPGGGTNPTGPSTGGDQPSSGPGGGTVVPTDPTPPHGTNGSVGTPTPTTGTSRPGSKPGTKTSAGFGIPSPGGLITKEATKAIGNTLAQVAQKPTIPLVLFGVVVGFLLLQNRIDRRDPKLASAPVGAEPELDFGPIQGLGGAPA